MLPLTCSLLCLTLCDRLREGSADVGGSRARVGARAEANPASRNAARADSTLRHSAGASCEAAGEVADGAESMSGSAGRSNGGKAESASGGGGVPPVVPVEVGMRVVIKWETVWAPETDGWVEVRKSHTPRTCLPCQPQL